MSQENIRSRLQRMMPSPSKLPVEEDSENPKDVSQVISSLGISFPGLLNISFPWQIQAQEETAIISWRECSKKSVQQGRSHFDARSVHGVREHGKMARTPLAAFFNIPSVFSNP